MVRTAAGIVAAMVVTERALVTMIGSVTARATKAATRTYGATDSETWM